MEKYNRDKDFNNQKDMVAFDQTIQSSKSDVDIDSIVNRIAALSINRVEREERLSRSEIETMI
ncbi:23934_t:CDS:1, partial [Racocetra persica]